MRMIFEFRYFLCQLSGYRFGDALAEEGDSFHSDEEDSGRHPTRVDRVHDHNDDSDDFADDEGMSNVEDSSSLEYLDESQYLEEDDHYTQFLLPPVPPQRQQSKTSPTGTTGATGATVVPSTVTAAANSSGSSSSNNSSSSSSNNSSSSSSNNSSNSSSNQQPAAASSSASPSVDVIVEPEYSEADPGTASGTFRSLPERVQSPPHHHVVTATSSLKPRGSKDQQLPASSLYSPVLDRVGVILPLSSSSFLGYSSFDWLILKESLGAIL